ncbi:MAG: ABC transporter permease [Proteobacteria bacterium]|nr:ABC transporter permease [Pseudomonadota bacterium]
MKARWEVLLLPSFIFCMALLIGTQFLFIRAGFFEDLGLGLLGTEFKLINYVELIQDPFYWNSLFLNIYLSAIVVVITLIFAYPVAYVVARMRSRWAMMLLAAIVVSSFVTIVIKALGLIIIFGTDGPLNLILVGLGIIDKPIKIVGNVFGVVVGLMHYVLGFMVLMLFSVIQAIPRSLEEAAQIHGASRWRVFARVVIPLSLPGVISGALIMFNLCMGAFVSAAILGGGKVLTLPVVIERTIVLESRYAMAGTLSAVLLLSVLLINLLSVYLVRRMRSARLVVT